MPATLTPSAILATRAAASDGATAWGFGVLCLCGVGRPGGLANCHRLPHTDDLHSDGLSVWETP